MTSPSLPPSLPLSLASPSSQPERSAQLEKALPSLTRLALKIRKGVVLNEDSTQEYMSEAHYLQKALGDGKIGHMQFGLMVGR